MALPDGLSEAIAVGRGSAFFNQLSTYNCESNSTPANLGKQYVLQSILGTWEPDNPLWTKFSEFPYTCIWFPGLLKKKQLLIWRCEALQISHGRQTGNERLTQGLDVSIGMLVV